ncbi:type II secretion system protein N [Sphingomicrobium sp. XHP0239]|uniref:type II secretion system protein N n=1 Tax=Sphingomicrobium maritimum TaxID=3133972 RepID=UPI0031CC9AB6
MFGSILRTRPGRRDRLTFAQAHVVARALLLAVLAAFAARLVWVFATPVGPIGDWQAASPRLLPAAAQSELLNRYDPFPQQQAATTSVGGEAVTDLDLELFGTRENRGTGMGSAIIAGADGEQASYQVGDEVAPGVTLAAVAFDYVTLDRGGVRERLYFEGAEPEAGAENTASAGEGGNTTAASASVPDLDFQPRQSGGRITGIRLPVSAEPALMAVYGLRQGDVIVSVNGVPVDSQSDIAQFQAALKPGARLSLQVERGGSTVPVAVTL